MVQIRNIDCIPAPVLRRMRACIAGFVDANDAHFGSPASAPTWRALVDSGGELTGPESLALERAFGVVLNVFRTGSDLQANAPSLESLLEERPGAGASLYAPDPKVLAMLHEPEDPSARAFARAITIFRTAIEKNLVNGDAVDRFLVDMLDRVPARTDLMRSAVETAKAFSIVLLEFLLGRSVD